MPLKKEMKPTRDIAEVFQVEKIIGRLPSNNLPTSKEVLEYYLHLRNQNSHVKQTV